ncbi:MAG TPA: M20 family metallopeptidase [Candidatus Acidoferrum sp.]|jgi:amidohydrolase|nr:M20 family metallopeptidase [Candidatus Acidoferrum sp.]
MRMLTPEWTQEIGRRHDSLVALRRDFHRHPELSFEERRTAEIIAERLHAAKLDVRTGLGRTGVVGVLHGDRPGRTIAWRADIDALPLTETFDAPFTSSTSGVMHACGHDGHTAIAITLAEMLAARRGELPGTAVFVFQPAEEVFGGAEPMIAAGALDNPRVAEIYGLHLTTQTAVGQVGIVPGPSMASADFFDVNISGRGGHGAYPHLSIDPITAAANILLGMQNLVSREVAAYETAVLTVGQIVGGTKHNIIPATAVMRGSLRTFNEQVRAQLKGRLADYAADIARAYRTEARLSFMGDGCPAVVNHARETAFVRECATAELGAAALNDGPPVMASDDMSLFLNARPGCYFRVGIAPRDGGPYPHHAPEFQMNEDGLPVGLRLGLAVMLNALAG